MRRLHLWRRASGVIRVLISVLLLAGAMLASSCERSEDVGPVGRPSHRGEDPKIKYPKEWKATLEETKKKAKFKLKFPNHELASRENLTDAFVFPQGGAVAFQFSPKKAPESPVEQTYFELYLTPYQGSDPKADYEAAIQEDPKGKELHVVNGEPALSDAPHDDELGTDVAFLRFVWNGVEIQLSGGESVDDLIAIAESLKDL